MKSTYAILTAAILMSGVAPFMMGCETLRGGAQTAAELGSYAPGPYGDAAKTIARILGPKTKNPVDGWDYRARLMYERDDGTVEELNRSRLRRHRTFFLVDGIDDSDWGPRLPAGEEPGIPDLTRDLTEQERVELEAALRIFQAIPNR